MSSGSGYLKNEICRKYDREDKTEKRRKTAKCQDEKSKRKWKVGFVEWIKLEIITDEDPFDWMSFLESGRPYQLNVRVTDEYQSLMTRDDINEKKKDSDPRTDPEDEEMSANVANGGSDTAAASVTSSRGVKRCRQELLKP